MANNPFEAAPFYLADDLIGGKCPLAGGTPDIDSPGIKNKNPGIDSRQFPPEAVKAELVIGRHQDRSVCIGMACGIKPRRNAVIASQDTGPGPDGAGQIPGPERCFNPGNRTDTRFDKVDNKVAQPVAGPGIWTAGRSRFRAATRFIRSCQAGHGLQSKLLSPFTLTVAGAAAVFFCIVTGYVYRKFSHGYFLYHRSAGLLTMCTIRNCTAAVNRPIISAGPAPAPAGAVTLPETTAAPSCLYIAWTGV